MIQTVATTEDPAAAGDAEKPLAALVRRRHDGGRSYRDMSETARKAGHTISHSQLQAYAQDAVRKAPGPEQMAALASALDVPFEQVRAAAMDQFYGYVPASMLPPAGLEDSTVVRIGAAIPSDLSDDEVAELHRLIRAWVAAREG